MSKFSAIVCDHCDARDVLEYLPVNGIKSYQLQIHTFVTGASTTDCVKPAPLTDMMADLCDECYKALTASAFSIMTQIPRKG